MKDVPAVNWPMPLADLNHPERWPMRGRNDPGGSFPEEASLTPAADDPPQKEVPDDELPREADVQGPE